MPTHADEERESVQAVDDLSCVQDGTFHKIIPVVPTENPCDQDVIVGRRHNVIKHLKVAVERVVCVSVILVNVAG